MPVTDPKITISAFKISYSSRCACWNKRESYIYFPTRLKSSSSSSYRNTDYAWLYRLSHKHSRVTPHTGAAYRHRWYNRVINHWGVYNFIKEPCRMQFTLRPRAPVLWLCRGDIALTGQCDTRNDCPRALQRRIMNTKLTKASPNTINSDDIGSHIKVSMMQSE